MQIKEGKINWIGSRNSNVKKTVKRSDLLRLVGSR